ncbi:EcsC family protein [Metabacillus litoralis]|uniref:EcsC family protein n=1 Tax=Metabacillus litoralis TaxID=152268 RepID=UPI00203E25A9|nr:EcsC family protein [Metabacillus litoralis]MCM3411613.1 EcsC family protein [Metabacillus litoralis]
MENQNWLQSELKVIEKWEQDQKGIWFWERIGRLPFKLLDKITPAFIQKKIGVLLDELGQFVQTGGQYLTQEKLVLGKLRKKAGNEALTLPDISSLPLATMDKVGEELKSNRSKLATIQGATTGVGGIFTLAIDIPVLLGLSLKTLQEIAITYGYDPSKREERIFIVKCLQFSSADIVGKQAILNELSSFYKRSENTNNEMISQLQGWREVVYTYRDQFGWKKLLQMVPIAGIVFGALTNRSMIHDLSETAIMLYRKRRILEKLDAYEKELAE